MARFVALVKINVVAFFARIQKDMGKGNAGIDTLHLFKLGKQRLFAVNMNGAAIRFIHDRLRIDSARRQARVVNEGL